MNKDFFKQRCDRVIEGEEASRTFFQEEKELWDRRLTPPPLEAPSGPATEQDHHPDYYGGKDDPYEAIKVIEAWKLCFFLGSVLKYVRRAGKKARESAIKDLKKARHCLDLKIQALEKEQG